MAAQLSTTVRNAVLNAVEATIGTTPVLKIRTGSVPASCATADSGTVLVSITLPSDWLTDAYNGVKEKNGVWLGSVLTSGTAGHFRLYASNGTTVHLQGTVGMGSGDLSLDDTALIEGQTVTISSASFTGGNA